MRFILESDPVALIVIVTVLDASDKPPEINTLPSGSTDITCWSSLRFHSCKLAL